MKSSLCSTVCLGVCVFVCVFHPTFLSMTVNYCKNVVNICKLNKTVVKLYYNLQALG